MKSFTSLRGGRSPGAVSLDFSPTLYAPFSRVSTGGGPNDLSDPSQPPACDWNPLPTTLTLDGLSLGYGFVNTTNTIQAYTGLPPVGTGASVVWSSGTEAVGIIGATV